MIHLAALSTDLAGKAMALITRSPEPIERRIRLRESANDRPNDDSRFVDCAPDSVTNVARRKMLARDPGYRKRKSSQAPARSEERATTAYRSKVS